MYDEFEYLVLTPLELANYLSDNVIPTGYEENKALNILGRQGWELVTISGGDTRIYNYYFKRKL